MTKVASTRTQQRILDNKISISEKCVDGLDEAAKGLMCATVSTGVAKMVSQSAILAFYDAAADGYQKLYDISLKGLKINGQKLLALPKVRLNRNNVKVVEGYILDAFIKDRSPNNPFTKLRNAEFYSCAFDATTEYVTSVNATFTRSVCDDGSVTVIPYELLKLSGSFTGEALCVVLADVVGKIGEVENSAFECINQHLKEMIER